MEKTGPITFVIWNQVARKTTQRVHANDFKMADIEDWGVPVEKERRRWRNHGQK